MVFETVSKATLFVAICGYAFLGNISNFSGFLNNAKWESRIEDSYVMDRTASYLGSPVGLLMRSEQSIEEDRVYVSVANRSGKWLHCDFGEGKHIRLSPHETELQLLPVPVDVTKAPSCIRG